MNAKEYILQTIARKKELEPDGWREQLEFQSKFERFNGVTITPEEVEKRWLEKIETTPLKNFRRLKCPLCPPLYETMTEYIISENNTIGKTLWCLDDWQYTLVKSAKQGCAELTVPRMKKQATWWVMHFTMGWENSKPWILVDQGIEIPVSKIPMKSHREGEIVAAAEAKAMGFTQANVVVVDDAFLSEEHIERHPYTKEEILITQE
jgi:hypothetical protein